MILIYIIGPSSVKKIPLILNDLLIYYRSSSKSKKI